MNRVASNDRRTTTITIKKTLSTFSGWYRKSKNIIKCYEYAFGMSPGLHFDKPFGKPVEF